MNVGTTLSLPGSPAGEAVSPVQLDDTRDAEDMCETEARGFLWEGCSREAEGALAEALEAYLSGLHLCRGPVWEITSYYLHHNAAHLLNRLGRFAEAEGLSRRALRIGPWLPDAYIRLGVSLVGQGRYAEATMAYIRAVTVSPREQRAFDMLMGVLKDHPEVLTEHDCLEVGLEECLDLAGGAFSVTPGRPLRAFCRERADSPR